MYPVAVGVDDLAASGGDDVDKGVACSRWAGEGVQEAG